MAEPGSTLVLGGTGTTGSRVAAALRERGHAARIATRRPSPDGEQVRFDWSAPDSYGPVLAGVARVYLVCPGAVVEAAVAEPFLAAALAAGVRRVVLLSSSATPEGSPGLGELHRMVAASLPEWTVLRPSWFMQNFVGESPLAAGIREAGEIVTATGDGRVGFVDASDIAAVALRALIDERPHNTEHLITGPHALSYPDAAAIISEVTGREVRHRSVGVTELTEHLVGHGYPAPLAAFLAALDDGVRTGSGDRTTDTVARLTGRPPRTFRDFVTDTFTGTF